MTPKEKAFKLFSRFYSLYVHPCSVHVRHQAAKETAIIACDEVLNTIEVPTDNYNFWKEVKQELEKL